MGAPTAGRILQRRRGQGTTAMDTYGNEGTGGAGAGSRTFGIEEELLLVDPGTGEAVPLAGPSWTSTSARWRRRPDPS
ncbi:hypothetical protein PV772_21535 [Pseudarthrobacter sp. CC12]|uniref:hypothetical protein n=1 Tax=Pseudarthrobacter sp. CC12 TaxID=3029193 RepID=UPI0032659819